MIHCTFAGHRMLMHGWVDEAVEWLLEALLEKDDAFCFYVGGDGAFDQLCARMVRKVRKKHPDKDIALYLVKPYMTQALNSKELDPSRQYDEIILPDLPDGCHYKRAIPMRNQWMVDQCTHIITYVFRPDGGAHQTLQYAQKKNLILLDTLSTPPANLPNPKQSP